MRHETFWLYRSRICHTSPSLGKGWPYYTSLMNCITHSDKLITPFLRGFMYHHLYSGLIDWFTCFLSVTGLKFAGDHNFLNYSTSTVLILNLLLLLGGAVLAFFLEFSEFLLVKKTSSLTLSVSAMVKVWRSQLLILTIFLYAGILYSLDYKTRV